MQTIPLYICDFCGEESTNKHKILEHEFICKDKKASEEASRGLRKRIDEIRLEKIKEFIFRDKSIFVLIMNGMYEDAAYLSALKIEDEKFDLPSNRCFGDVAEEIINEMKQIKKIHTDIDNQKVD